MIQAGLIAKASYDVIKLWKKTLCSKAILDEKKCAQLDNLLIDFNGALSLYSKTTVYWYNLETTNKIQIDRKTAIAMIFALLDSKDEIMKGISSISTGKEILPMIPDFTEFVNWAEKYK
jgi:hypothetical protein